jgi:hypothetical protein
VNGADEAGTIAAPPALAYVVADALAPLDVRHVDTPLPTSASGARFGRPTSRTSGFIRRLAQVEP